MPDPFVLLDPDVPDQSGAQEHFVCRLQNSLQVRGIALGERELFGQPFERNPPGQTPVGPCHLEDPVQAWGNESDTIVISPNRVMVAVEGSLDAVTAQLEQSLAQSSQSPLSGALDDKHALVIFEADQPGLEGMVLLGCEYRIPEISLLDDPADAWRKKQPKDQILPSQSHATPSKP